MQDDPSGFTEFWSVYPRRIAKIAARKAYDKALRITTHERIMAAAVQYARIYSVPAQGFRPDPKHPTTWLNGGCWDDESAPERQRPGVIGALDRLEAYLSGGDDALLQICGDK